MKTLIFAILSNILSLGTNSQTTIVAQKPTILHSTTKSNWHIVEVLPTVEGNILIGRSRNQQNENKTFLVKTNKKGSLGQTTELPLQSALAACLSDDALIVLSSSIDKSFLTKISTNKLKEIVWQTEISKIQKGSIASLPSGRIALTTDTDSYIKTQIFNSKGQFLKDVVLKNPVKESLHKSKIIAIKNGTFALIGGGKIWGLNESGDTIWEFGSETEQIKWQNIKQLSNGEIIAIGYGNSQIYNSNNIDIHVWAIANDGSSISWAKIIGENENKDIAYDIVESVNEQLMILAQKDKHTQLIKLDNDHQASIIYTDSISNSNRQLKYLTPLENGNWLAIGDTWEADRKGIIFQNYQQKIIQDTINKPSLFLLSIGVKADLQFTKHDAEAISNLYKKQEGKLFKAVYTQTLTADSSTKAGELAKAFELLSTKGIQNDDIVIIYFSGNGLATDDDYLLLGSDYDPAALRSTSIRMSQLLHDLDNLPGKKLILLDACYSGAAIKIPSNVSILTASTANQPAFEDPEWQHGAFTKVILEAMKNKKADTNADNFTSLQELFDFTKKNLPLLTQRKRIQNPLLLHKGDDFVVFEK